MARTSRRTLIAGAGAALVAQACASANPKAEETARPNILWLVSEDNNPWLGAYGDRIARTPNLDRLAREGLLYRNAYSNAPVCAPSRFGIITGVLPESCAPANHMRAIAKLPPTIRAFPTYLREAGYHCTNNAKTDYNCDIDPAKVWNQSSRNAHWRSRNPDQPFIAVFNYETTHESQLFRRTDGAVQPKDVRIPAYLPDSEAMRQDFASYYNLIEKMDGQIGARLAELDADGLSEDTIVFYYSDNGGVLPRSKRFCYDEGLHCAMIVRVPAKWAHLAPPPGSEVDAPASFIDLAPTVLALAGVAPPAHMQGQPLLEGRRGAKRPSRYAFGMRNRMDERYDFVRTATDGRHRYIRNYMPHRPGILHGAYAWQAAGYQDWDRRRIAGTLSPVQRRFFQPKPFEEFYDLSADPDEVDNRIADPALAGRVQAMRKALDAHMLRINDNGFIPEGASAEGYLESQAAGVYPLADLMALATMAGARKPENAAALAARLGDHNESIRHWAAQGLLMLGPAAAPHRDALAAMMASDALLQNRIVAAEALAHLGDPSAPLGVLTAALEPGNPMPAQLAAINSLTYLGETARPTLPAVVRLSEGEPGYPANAARYLRAVLEGVYDPAMKIFAPDAITTTVSRSAG